MRNFNILLLVVFVLTGCNSVYVKPNTLDVSKTVYADRGGYTMQRSIKETMTKRGYKVVVGKAKSNEHAIDNSVSIDIDTNIVPKDAPYVVKTKEMKDIFRPVWCAFNGFWWWNFNVSIADQKTGEEVMTWRGRGCANSSIRKLNKILDIMEIKEN
ncbi:MAG: hypothetical protein IKZ34_02615 [Alphaproteobacteria bacterium]|nr:hypothetical protein [Alphaproteobacteria bacterium]